MRAHKDTPTHWGQRLGHRQHSVLLFRLQWKNLPFDPGVFPTPRKEAARECCASALTKRDRQWINAHHLCVSAAFLSATWSIHYPKLSYSTGNALPSRAFSFQTPRLWRWADFTFCSQPSALQDPSFFSGFYGLKLSWFISPSPLWSVCFLAAAETFSCERQISSLTSGCEPNGERISVTLITWTGAQLQINTQVLCQSSVKVSISHFLPTPSLYWPNKGL